MSKNNENKLVPKLRFPDFIQDGNWESDSVQNLISTIAPAKKLNSSEYFTKGKYPIVDQSQDFYCGWTDDSDAVISNNLPLIIFGDHTCILKLVHEPFAQGADGIKIIKPKGALITEFLFQHFNFNGVKQDGYKRHYSILKEKIVSYPNIKTGEQQKIAACLSSLDEVITAESQKLEVLKDHKKGLLQNLLPQAGETVPKFRFKEFEDSGEWVFDTFSEYIKLYRGSSPRPIQNYFTTDDTGVNWIKIGDTKNADNFIIKQVEERITPEGAEKSRKVNVGELILANSMSFGKTYQLAIEGYIYDGWFVLREYEQYFDKQFLLQLLNSDYMQTHYKKLSAGGIVQNISSDIVYKTILPHTSIDEQKQIAASLTSLDEFISAQSKKVEALQLHKKGLLQGLFPNVSPLSP